MVEEEASCVQEEQPETLDPAKCTTEQHAYTVQCTEDGHVLHWVRMEQHRWSDWQVEKEPDCENQQRDVAGILRHRRTRSQYSILDGQSKIRRAPQHLCGLRHGALAAAGPAGPSAAVQTRG